jgi:nucleotide-binding universal stress UspA family protein
MANPIIVGVDPRRGDDAPLHLASALTAITGEPLVAVASYPHEVTTTRTSASFERELRADATTRLERLAAGFDAELLVVGGPSPARVLHDAAEARDASMIVVGSTRRGRFGRVAPGSTAERLLHGAPCAVAIATGGLPDRWRLSQVGVAFLDGEEGHEALRAGAALAHAAGASVRAVTVIEPFNRRQSAAIAAYLEGGGAVSRKASAQRALDDALADVPSGVDIAGEIVEGRTVDALVALSENVDLLVCGSRGYGPRAAVLLGGVTHRLTRQASCPVIVIPRGVEGSLHTRAAREEAAAR